MNLHQAKKGTYAAIRALYISAFPKNERAPFFLIKRRVMQKRATMLVAEENGVFIGFTYTVSFRNAVYLFFFAVNGDKRGCGYGSEILRLLKQYYEGKTVFLAREPLDDTADNKEERIRRRCFYLRNGFTDLPYQIKEASVVYDIMSTSENFDPADYRAIMRSWAGALMFRLVKMEAYRLPDAAKENETPSA